MNLESQVCSLDLAKRLKELGVKEESLFKYYSNDRKIYKIIYGHWHSWVPVIDKLSAYTVTELGEMLPLTIKDKDSENFELCSYIYSNRKFCIYYINKVKVPAEFAEFKADYSEVNARARMLIYLIENNLVSVEEINQRITT